ncbi:MAG: hypothetical protein IPN72_05180 [Saprospiraceae bacterium]|nr:hypothetical protein [Saprospiraceae bacterium]
MDDTITAAAKIAKVDDYSEVSEFPYIEVRGRKNCPKVFSKFRATELLGQKIDKTQNKLYKHSIYLEKLSKMEDTSQVTRSE